MAANVIPDTVSYLYLGLAAIAALMGISLLSLFMRYRSAVRELQRLEAPIDRND